MNLQRAGAYPAQPNRAQAQALDALGNIQDATKGADERVQQAYEKTIRHLQEALKQSEANNGLLSAKVALLNERNIQLEQKSEQLNGARQVKYQAVEERFQFLNERVLELLKKVSTHPEQVINCTEARLMSDLCVPFNPLTDSGSILYARNGFAGGPPSAFIAFLMQKIDPDYRERVKSSDYNPKIICEETESTKNSIIAALLDIEAEFKKVLKDLDE